MTYKFDSQFIGYPPIEAAVPVPASLQSLPIAPGFIATAEDPVFGPGEFIFARAGAAIKLYAGCVLTEVWDATNKVYTYNMTEWPVTATLGRPVYVYQGDTALTTGQYGWFLMTGRTPVNSTASIAADSAAGRAAAGQLTASGAGVQVLGLRTITPATNTVTSPGFGLISDTKINLSSTAGFFPGGTITGTGVGAGAVVTKVDPLGKFILVSVASTAAVSGTITQTAQGGGTFFNVATMNRPMAQGIA